MEMLGLIFRSVALKWLQSVHTGFDLRQGQQVQADSVAHPVSYEVSTKQGWIKAFVG
jgi:hypothetical protein